MSDGSRAATRTILAWHRTALALGALAAIMIKLALSNHSAIGATTAVLSLIAAVALYIASSGLVLQRSPLILIIICSNAVVLLAIATLLQIS